MEKNNYLNQKISLKIVGSSMEEKDGFNLHYLINSLSGINDIIEKTYLYSYDKNRISDEDLEKLIVTMTLPKKGSFKTDIIISIRENIIPLLPLIAENGVTLWKAVKESYEFLKLLIDTRKEGSDVQITQSGDGIIVTGSNNTITINNNIPNLAKQLAPSFQKMANNVNGQDITEIILDDKNGENDIVLTNEDKERFKKQTLTSDVSEILQGKIVSADSMTFKGKIETQDGIVSFRVVDELKDESRFKEIFLNDITIECRKKFEINPSKEEIIRVTEIIVEKVY